MTTHNSSDPAPSPQLPTIVRVIARLNVGGPAVQAILMTEAFARRGYRALLLSGEVPDGEQTMEYLAREKRVTITRIAEMSRSVAPLRDFCSLARIVHLLHREKPTIVHTHTAKAGVLGRIASILTRVPVRVHTFHGHVFDGYFSQSVARCVIWLERLLARHTDCIVTVSERQRHDLVHRYRIADEAKVVVVPLGFEVEHFLDQSAACCCFRDEVQCSSVQPLIGWIGRFAPVKDPELFVTSAAACHADVPDAKFVMIGDGKLSGLTGELTESLGLGGVITNIGSRSDMPAVYAALDMVVLTSRNEGTPVVLLEAMASGKPFVATDVGGVGDLVVGSPRQMYGFSVFDNGILAERAPRAIARAIAYLLDHPQLRREMGEAGRKFVTQHHSSRRLADDLERLYLQLATRKFEPHEFPSAWTARLSADDNATEPRTPMYKNSLGTPV